MEEKNKTKLEDKIILSINEWKELVMNNPKLIRNAPEYIKDALLYFGKEEYIKFGRRMTRFKGLSLSDQPDERLVNHEWVQTRIYEILTTLCRDNSKMILLVGPNGSAKSTIWNSISYMLEEYSKTPDGARYQIEWVFPADEEDREIGFSGRVEYTDKTFAFLDDSKLDKIKCDAGCNPALLYTKEAKEKYFYKSKTKLLTENKLCPKCNIIIHELLNLYKTQKQSLTKEHSDEILDLVSRHIRIRKVEISKTYQRGIAVVDPGTNPLMLTQKPYDHYDPFKRKKPYALRNVDIPEFTGPLSKACNGLLIMEDSVEGIFSFISQFLNDKRKVNISGERFTLDMVLVGSINPEKFNRLKEDPEYNRFRTRLEVINVPYILEYSKETEIYRNKMNDLRKYYHIAPHTEELFALFCVMTRLEGIMQNTSYKGYEKNKVLLQLKDKLRKLTLLDKAKLYDTGKLPEKTYENIKFTPEEQNNIENNLDIIYNEYQDREGRTFGMSYREVDVITDRALMDSPKGFLSPISLKRKLEEIIQYEKDDYPFFKQTNKDYLKLIEFLDEEYFRIINIEIQDIFDLDYEIQIVKQIEEYLVKGLKVIYVDKSRIKNQAGDDITNIFLDEREKFIFGEVLTQDNRSKFWYTWSGKVDPKKTTTENILTIFENQIKQTRERLYLEKKSEIEKKLDDILLILEGGKLENRTPREIQELKKSIDKLINKGYNNDSAIELIGYLKRNIERLVKKK